MSQYVRTGKLGRRLGRLARAHRLSGVRGSTRAGLGDSLASAIVHQRLGLMDYVTTDDYGNPINVNESSGVITSLSPNPIGPTYGGASSSMPGAISPLDASLISQGISTAGVLAKQALTPTPTVSYNAATGQYTATGGATLPASLTSTSLTALLANPTVLLLGGGLLLVVVLMGRK